MNDPKAFPYHISKLKYLINQIESKWSFDRNNSNLYSLTKQAVDLIELIQNNIKPIDWYRNQNKYSHLIFTEVDDPNYIVKISNSLYEFSFEQAKNTRDSLIADGLIHFAVKYESNGEIDWDTRFDASMDFLREFKNQYDHVWSIKRSELNPDHYFFTIKKPLETTLEEAVTMANNIKRRYIYVTPIVYYGPQNEKKIIGSLYDNMPNPVTTDKETE